MLLDVGPIEGRFDREARVRCGGVAEWPARGGGGSQAFGGRDSRLGCLNPARIHRGSHVRPITSPGAPTSTRDVSSTSSTPNHRNSLQAVRGGASSDTVVPPARHGDTGWRAGARAGGSVRASEGVLEVGGLVGGRGDIPHL